MWIKHRLRPEICAFAFAFGLSLIAGGALAAEESAFRFRAIDPGGLTTEGRFVSAAVHLDIVGADARRALGGQSATVSLDIDCAVNSIGVRAVTIFARPAETGRAVALQSRDAWAQSGGDAFITQVSRAACDQAPRAAILSDQPAANSRAIPVASARAVRPYLVRIGLEASNSAALRQLSRLKRSARLAGRYALVVRGVGDRGRRQYEITAGNFSSIKQARSFCAENIAITRSCLVEK